MAQRSTATAHGNHRTRASSAAEKERAPRSPATGGARRGVWTGSISFGLLQIPVTLHPAEVRTQELHFRLLDKRDLTPLRFERVNAATGKPVEWKDVVKGYEVEKDAFVVVEPEDFAKANVEKTQTIDIQDFVPRDQIDAAFFETPYYVVPQGRAAKAYLILRDALEKKNAVAIATFVLRTREHLVAVMPVPGLLMLETLRFGHELLSSNDVPLPETDAHASAREVGMAEQLIEGMMSAWDPSKYQDRYYRDLMALIEEKAKTGVAKAHHTEQKCAFAHDVVDLLDLLKKSVARTRAVPANDAKRGPKKETKKKAGAKRARGHAA
jgi:DNA end-binding protein Ku